MEGGGGGLDQKYHFGAGGCPTATVLHGGQNRQSRASRRCDILKCLQPAAGNRIHIQGHSRGAADVLKCGRTLVLAQATLTSNGILPAAISRITSDQEQEKKAKRLPLILRKLQQFKERERWQRVFFCLLKFHNLVSALRTPSGNRAFFFISPALRAAHLCFHFGLSCATKLKSGFLHTHIYRRCAHTCALPWT